MRSRTQWLIVAVASVLLSTMTNTAVMAKSAASQAAQKDEPQPSAYGPVYQIGKHVSAPALAYAPEAKFPKTSKKEKKIQGVVLIRLIVDKDGMPQDVHVIRSFRDDFDAEALNAVKEYRFKPAMRFKKPVAVFIMVEVNFARN